MASAAFPPLTRKERPMSEQTLSSEETAPFVGFGVEWDDENKERRCSRSVGINCMLKKGGRVVVGS